MKNNIFIVLLVLILMASIVPATSDDTCYDREWIDGHFVKIRHFWIWVPGHWRYFEVECPIEPEPPTPTISEPEPPTPTISEPEPVVIKPKAKGNGLLLTQWKWNGTECVKADVYSREFTIGARSSYEYPHIIVETHPDGTKTIQKIIPGKYGFAWEPLTRRIIREPTCDESVIDTEPVQWDWFRNYSWTRVTNGTTINLI